MSAEHDVTRVVRSWLREDEHDSADRVLESVLSRLDTTPQRRSWWPARRASQMNNVTRLAIAAAAVLAVAVVGYNLLPRNASVGGQPTPSPSPRPFPSAGVIDPGRYFWTVSGVRVTVNVPSGWVVDPGGVRKPPDASQEIGWGPEARPVTRVYADACKSEGTLNVVGPSAADLATALEQQLGSTAVVTTIDLGGLAATRIDLADDPGLDRSQCRYGPEVGAEGPLQIWADPAETSFYALCPGCTGTVVTLDVRGARLVFTGSKSSAARPADVAEVDAMIDSMVIER